MHFRFVQYLLVSLAWLQAGLPAPARADSRQERPNVILILADDLGYGDLACYGHPQFQTPRLDRMAAEGARFTQFYVPVPYCAPTRGSLLTGRYPFRTGVWTNPSPDTGKNDVGIPWTEVTLGEALRGAGYATAHVGKWHLGHRREFYPIRHGFDEYYGILYSNDMRPVELIEGDRVVEYPVVQADLTRKYTDRSLRFIESHRDRPFFLYLAHAMPHKPLAASEDYYGKTGTGLYGDVVTELDASVGRILDRLRELELERRTLVVFLSDNGPWYGGSTGRLRGMKSMVWEGGIRVPMIVRWPGRIPAGQTHDAMASALDIFPTILEACGVDPTENPVDGHSLLSLWTGNEHRSPHEAIFFLRGEELMGVRAGRWKLHVGAPRVKLAYPDDWVDPRAPDGVTILAPYEQARPSEFPGLLTGDSPKPGMLFDLEADPGEQHDVADSHPEIVERLEKIFRPMQREAERLMGNAAQ